ncbi:ferredoxin [Saccharopolyspora gloriosae]|uniref:Ferredoxin n=1 Tax=Saccharopolyspora gloriosae TaxID=455344 RepID=A0A840NMU3_9PSEU|nr:ferredoxin [Saccharopolyspora gloriosae]MBB5071325.1 ferredoxin [Saccharopolyspora gloriosae]
MKITIDEDRCCGAGQCVLEAPDVFDQRAEDGVVVLLDAAPPAELHEASRSAEQLCPTAAIEISE